MVCVVFMFFLIPLTLRRTNKQIFILINNNVAEVWVIIKAPFILSYCRSEHIKDGTKERHLWQVEDFNEDTPLCVKKRMVLACQHGKAQQKKEKVHW